MVVDEDFAIGATPIELFFLVYKSKQLICQITYFCADHEIVAVPAVLLDRFSHHDLGLSTRVTVVSFLDTRILI